MRRRSGFTLAEIILVIVIGFVLLYVALATYANAKTSAGLARARDKIYSLQQVVEQMAASNGGNYPHLDQVCSTWAEKNRDVDKSPFGGRVRTGFDNSVMTAAIYQGAATTYYGIDGRAGCDARPCYGGEIPAYPTLKSDMVPSAYPSPDAMYAKRDGLDGLIEYRRIFESNRTATASFFELTTNKMSELRAYAISIRNPEGQPILFVGGAPLP